MAKRAKEETEEEVAAAALAAKKAAKKAKKAAAAAAVEEEEEEDPVAAKKAAKKAKKAAAAAAAAEEEEEAPAPAKKDKKKKAAAAEEEEEDEPVKKEAPKKEEPKKAEPAAAAGDDEEFKDNTYKCCDCSEDWVDTADDQQFRWDKGFAETPKRCKDCRWAKKVRMEGGDPAAKKGKSKGKGGNNDLTVFVRGLPFATTEEALNKDFAECGEVVSCRMPLNDDYQCKGIAFIAYADKESMDKALAFNETDYGGRTIFCVPAADKPEGKGKGKDGKDGKDKGKGKDGKGKKGKKGKAPSESFAKSTGAMVESTGEKKTFDDSDDE